MTGPVITVGRVPADGVKAIWELIEREERNEKETPRAPSIRLEANGDTHGKRSK